MRALAIAGVSVLVACLTAHAEEGPLQLVSNRRAVSIVVIPRDARRWTHQAAEWLQEYVRRATTAELQVVTEDKAPAGTLISVGHTRLAEKAGIHTRDLKYDGCKLVVKGNVLYLIGRESAKEIKSNPNVGAHGTCRAVLTFLEDWCGVRWFLPTREGEIVPEAKDISVPRTLAKTAVPAFAYSDGRFTYTPEFLGVGGKRPASIINNFRDGITVWPGGHTYYQAVPAKEYFERHPEYFALINGKRTGKGNHLCTSNPEVKRILVRWMRERFDEGYEMVSIGQEDGFRRCECPECEKLDDYRYESSGLGWDDFMYGSLRDTPCDRLFLLHKAVIDEVGKSHPDRKVLLMCYAPTAWPSKKIACFGDNVIGELMNQEPKFIKAWQGKVAGLSGYVYWFNVVTPMGMDVHATPREVAEKIRYLHENGFIGLYQFAETGWGFQGPVFYSLGKLMGDPYLNHKALVEDYCRGVYDKAGDTMLKFFNLLYARHEEVLPLATEDFAGRMNKMPRWITTTQLYLMMYPPGFLRQLDQLLLEAEAKADTERSRGWVRLTRDHYDFTRLLTHALISYRAWQANGTRENRLELRERVEAFDAYRKKIITYAKDYSDRRFPGYDHFCNYLTASAKHEAGVYYIPWQKRKADVLRKGVKGRGIGYGGSHGYSYVKEPLTLNFSKGD